VLWIRDVLSQIPHPDLTIAGHIIGILHANTGFCRKEWKVLYVIALHRLPMVA
jgi:hypothetical protein